MTSLKEEAMNYSPPKKNNISDLEAIPTDVKILDGESETREGKPYKYKFIVMNGEDYKVPGIVLGSLKDILEVNPDLKFFKVSNSGTDSSPKYTVIQLDEPKEVEAPVTQ